MATHETELADFSRFLTEQLSSGETDITPEQALELWRTIQREREDANEGIRRGLEDVRAGRGDPLDQYVSGFKKANNITDDG